MEKEFIEWFKANEKRFEHGQLSEKEIAYSAWLEGQKQTLCTHDVKGLLFYQKVEKLINKWKTKELGEALPYSPEAEIEAGMKYFLRWLKEQNIE